MYWSLHNIKSVSSHITILLIQVAGNHMLSISGWPQLRLCMPADLHAVLATCMEPASGWRIKG